MSDFRLTPDDEDDDKLRELARKIFVPSRPITIRQALRGRGRQLDRTLEALETPGRSVFIFGERGVGKTSLALTAAYLFNSSEVDPIRLACHRRSTFGEIVAQVVRHLRALEPEKHTTKMTKELKVKLGSVLSIMRRIEEKPDETLVRLDPNLAVDLFEAACPKHLSRRIVVLVDEVDTVEDAATRADLSYLIKQLGDRDCSVKFIFVGIGESVEALLREHESASRYMATIQLDRLSLDELRAIVADGFHELGIDIEDRFCWRMSMISDGFAHFTHLVGLKLALRAIDQRYPPRFVDSELFSQAVLEAIEDSEAALKQAYDQAVQKYKDVYEPVLWAAADHWELLRSIDQIYTSYVRICAELGRTPEEKRPTFYNRMAGLRRDEFGPALVQKRRSWYQFKLAMLRGYCRLVAESKGVELGPPYGA